MASHNQPWACGFPGSGTGVHGICIVLHFQISDASHARHVSDSRVQTKWLIISYL
jgi:hypothetical protein